MKPATGAVLRRHASGPPFVVVDVETSGLNPRQDRVIEIGIVHLDSAGRPTERWGTLVNPETGRAGPTHVHGIESSWLVVAPTFADVAGDIVQRLRGRVLVAHNARFDCEFLEEEFKRIGTPLGDVKVLCTMDLAGQLGLPAKLSHAASLLGFRFDHHTAAEDAEAASRILAEAIKVGMSGYDDAAVSDRVLPVHLEPCGRVQRRDAAREITTARPFLSKTMLTAVVPDADRTTDEQSYLDVLERALEDGVLDPRERQQLTDLANRIGITHDEAMDLHHDLVLSMLDTALEDGRIAKPERAEIEQAARWLDVDLSGWDAMVKAARARARESRHAFRESVQGKVVTFTGRGVHPNAIREALAAKNGMTFKTRVVADTDLVVLGSEGTDNQQTAAAIERGLPICIEAGFWQRLGVS